MSRRLQDSVVVITGASSGIGRATAEAFAEQGAAVVLAARGAEALIETVRACQALGGRMLAVPTDVTDPQAVEKLAQQALAAFGRIDVWVNNAGTSLYALFEDSPIHEFRQVIETNFFGCVYGAQAALPIFRKQGGGVLINVASLAAAIPMPYSSCYVASKAAVRAFSDCLRMELSLTSDHNIHVCTVMPSAIDTPFFEHAANRTGHVVKPIDPVYPAEQVAETIVSLARHPRREVIVGEAGRLMALQTSLAPGLHETLGARALGRNQLEDQPARPTEGNLFASQNPHSSVSGGWPLSSRRFNLGGMLLLGLAVGLPAALLLARNPEAIEASRRAAARLAEQARRQAPKLREQAMGLMSRS